MILIKWDSILGFNFNCITCHLKLKEWKKILEFKIVYLLRLIWLDVNVGYKQNLPKTRKNWLDYLTGSIWFNEVCKWYKADKIDELLQICQWSSLEFDDNNIGRAGATEFREAD